MKLLWKLTAIAFILSGCFFGSTLVFTEEDASGRENLVFNADLEGGEFENNRPEDSLPLGWMVMPLKGDKKTTIRWDNLEAHNGTRSIRVDTDDTNISLISEAFEIKPRSAYYTRFYMKLNGDDQLGIKAVLAAFDEHGQMLNETRHRQTIADGWTKVEFSAAFFKKNAKFARIIVQIDTGRNYRLWIDDFASYEVYRFTTTD
ncbi:MAG: hypothetical protein K8S56_06730 [Candidatus Cloacimonetes bacterium]|nr:hypothetical protein [Candidatus Cloacimonadota bacterium]